jgi:hypothetical protein
MATCEHPRRDVVEHVGLAHAGSRHTPDGDWFPRRSRHPVPCPSLREHGRRWTSDSGTPEPWCGQETWLLVHRREPERTYRTCGCVEHRQGRGGRGASNRCCRHVRSSGSHPVSRTAPRPSLDGRKEARSVEASIAPRPSQTTRAKRPWKQTNPQVLRPERTAQPGAPGTPRTPWSAPGRRTIGPAPVMRGAHGSTDERREGGARFAVRRSGTARISSLRARGRQKSTGHTLDAR